MIAYCHIQYEGLNVPQRAGPERCYMPWPLQISMLGIVNLAYGCIVPTTSVRQRCNGVGPTNYSSAASTSTAFHRLENKQTCRVKAPNSRRSNPQRTSNTFHLCWLPSSSIGVRAELQPQHPPYSPRSEIWKLCLFLTIYYPVRRQG